MRHSLIAGLALMLGACVPAPITDQILFLPQRAPKAERVEDMRLRDEAWLKTMASVQHGFFGDGDQRIAYTLAVRADAGRPLIVHCGGNAADRYNDGAFYAGKVLPFGDVLLFDYPGYGDTPGAANAANLQAMSAQLAPALSGFKRDVVLWGHSLGGFVCADLARRVPEARAIVLETTALNVSEIAAAWTPPWASAFVRPAIAPHLLAFDNAAALKEFTGPILVLTAARDSVLPARLSRSLAARLAGGGLAVTEVTFANAGHLDVSRQPQFAPTMQAFLARIGAPGAQP